MKIPKNIAELIEKYQEGTANPQEISLLNEWYHSFDDSKAELEADYNENEEQLAQKMHARLLETIGADSPQPAIKRYYKWWTAAAAIVLITLAGFYFFSKEKKETGSTIAQSVPLVNDLAPGGNKAILTLSDGSTLILDNEADGVVSKQGVMKVEKLPGGLVSYTIDAQMMENVKTDQVFYNTIATPRGGQYQVTLSDGTKVWLNAASSIRFPVVFTGNERKVKITGEAYFEVSKNEKMPFKVEAENSEVEVLGTHFNINAYTDEEAIKTTLLEGKVKISVPGNPSSRMLAPGQQSGIIGGKISVLDNADTEEAVAWKNGRFQFKSADLNSILRQLSRWYDVDVEYKDKLDLHFTGQLTRNVNVSKVFDMLQLTGEVNFTINGKKIIVSR